MWRRMMCGTAAIASFVSIKGKRWGPSSVVNPDPKDPYVMGYPDLGPSLYCTDPDLGPNRARKASSFRYFIN
jgi:hypothetical protein